MSLFIASIAQLIIPSNVPKTLFAIVLTTEDTESNAEVKAPVIIVFPVDVINVYIEFTSVVIVRTSPSRVFFAKETIQFRTSERNVEILVQTRVIILDIASNVVWKNIEIQFRVSVAKRTIEFRVSIRKEVIQFQTSIILFQISVIFNHIESIAQDIAVFIVSRACFVRSDIAFRISIVFAFISSRCRYIRVANPTIIHIIIGIGHIATNQDAAMVAALATDQAAIRAR
jgi:hypothetical protein